MGPQGHLPTPGQVKVRSLGSAFSGRHSRPSPRGAPERRPPPRPASPHLLGEPGRGENASSAARPGGAASRPRLPPSPPGPKPQGTPGAHPPRGFLLVPARPSPAAPSPWLRGLGCLGSWGWGGSLGAGRAPGLPSLPLELGSFKIRSRLHTADSRPAYLGASLRDTR